MKRSKSQNSLNVQPAQFFFCIAREKPNTGEHFKKVGQGKIGQQQKSVLGPFLKPKIFGVLTSIPKRQVKERGKRGKIGEWGGAATGIRRRLPSPGPALTRRLPISGLMPPQGAHTKTHTKITNQKTKRQKDRTTNEQWGKVQQMPPQGGATTKRKDQHEPSSNKIIKSLKVGNIHRKTGWSLYAIKDS